MEVYFWPCWTKGSRGSSMEDILELGLLQLAVLRLGSHHFISMVVLLRPKQWK
uniref:Uncharacterized protein n=1 Tax=Arundo donax TaxID=35708 RepID=A0A0A9GW57_ARUDO